MSLRLHPTYGVNPSLDCCAWCGEATGVALLGYNKDREAPRKIVTSFDPCGACAANMALGITFFEARMVDGKPQPTGSYFVVKPEALDYMIGNETLRADILKARKCAVEPEAFAQFSCVQDAQKEK